MKPFCFAQERAVVYLSLILHSASCSPQPTMSLAHDCDSCVGQGVSDGSSLPAEYVTFIRRDYPRVVGREQASPPAQPMGTRSAPQNASSALGFVKIGISARWSHDYPYGSTHSVIYPFTHFGLHEREVAACNPRQGPGEPHRSEEGKPL